jgi:hypothetical protein
VVTKELKAKMMEATKATKLMTKSLMIKMTAAQVRTMAARKKKMELGKRRKPKRIVKIYHSQLFHHQNPLNVLKQQKHQQRHLLCHHQNQQIVLQRLQPSHLQRALNARLRHPLKLPLYHLLKALSVPPRPLHYLPQNLLNAPLRLQHYLLQNQPNA